MEAATQDGPHPLTNPLNPSTALPKSIEVPDLFSNETEFADHAEKARPMVAIAAKKLR